MANSAGSYSNAPYYPSARASSYAWSQNLSGSTVVWIFGGANNDGNLGDLWKLNVTGKSTVLQCVGCSTENANLLPSYGTQGYYAVSNTPGGSSSGTSWLGADGNLYLMGGAGGASGTGRYNDLWGFNTKSGSLYYSMWSWRSGANLINELGIYSGTVLNPGARTNMMGFISGTALGLFGGYGYDVNSNLGDLNDVWSYNPVSTSTFVDGNIRSSSGVSVGNSFYNPIK